MKHQVKNTLRELAGHFGLKVKFVSYFKADVHGQLLPRERRILINAHQPRVEHVFTLLHEIGHFVVHHLNPQRDYNPWYLRKDWHSERLTAICFKLRRHLRFMFHRTAGKEWEADLWALCAFIVLARQLKCRADLMSFLGRHRRKMPTFLLAAGVIGCIDVKNGLVNYSKRLLLPFKPA